MIHLSKKLFFGMMIVFLVGGACEITVSLLLYLKTGSFVSRKERRKTIQEVAVPDSELSAIHGSSVLGDDKFSEVIHPYIGFVIDPGRDKHRRVSPYGFMSGKDVSPFYSRSDDKLIMALFGGSFAGGVYWSAYDVFKERLAPDKELIYLCFATGGYKQPQQALILAWLMSMGAEFDLVVNLDGFNEVALPPCENIPYHVFPFYPRMWHARVQDMIDATEIKRLGEIEFLKERRQKWAHFFTSYQLYSSRFFYFIWQRYDMQLQNKIFRLSLDIAEKNKVNVMITKETLNSLRDLNLPDTLITLLESNQYKPFNTAKDVLDWLRQELDSETYKQYAPQILQFVRSEDLSKQFAMHGPDYRYSSDDQLFSDLAYVWKTSSLMMDDLCKAHKIKYYHFLQPNQYVEDSKPMSPEERKIAFLEDHPYRKGVLKGYPFLLKEGSTLLEKGVHFFELTTIFSQEPKILYTDSCCHLNHEGYAIVAEKICNSITDSPDFFASVRK